MADWIVGLPKELVWEGPSGCSIQRMWELVELLKKDRSSNAAASLWPGIDDADATNATNATSLADDHEYKQFLWTSIVALNDIVFLKESDVPQDTINKISFGSSYRDDKLPSNAVKKTELLNIPYDTTLERYPSLTVVVNPSLYTENVLMGVRLPARFSPVTLNALHIIARARADGFTQADLARVCNIENRSLYSTLNQLINISLIVKVPYVVKGTYTNLVIHKSFAQQNAFFNAIAKHKHQKVENVQSRIDHIRKERNAKGNADESSTNSQEDLSDVVMENSSSQTTNISEGLSTDEALTSSQLHVLRAKISHLVAAAKNGIARFDDTVSLLLMDQHAVRRKRVYVRRVITGMEARGYIKKISVRGPDGRLARCLQHVKPFNLEEDMKNNFQVDADPSGVDTLVFDKDTPLLQRIDHGKVGLLRDLPIEYQFYRLIVLSHTAGTFKEEIGRKLSIVAKKFLIRLTERLDYNTKLHQKLLQEHLKKVEEGTAAGAFMDPNNGIMQVAEFLGKTRSNRLYTVDAFNEKVSSSSVSAYNIHSYFLLRNGISSKDSNHIASLTGPADIIPQANPNAVQYDADADEAEDEIFINILDKPEKKIAELSDDDDDEDEDSDVGDDNVDSEHKTKTSTPKKTSTKTEAIMGAPPPRKFNSESLRAEFEKIQKDAKKDSSKQQPKLTSKKVTPRASSKKKGKKVDMDLEEEDEEDDDIGSIRTTHKSSEQVDDIVNAPRPKRSTRTVTSYKTLAADSEDEEIDESESTLEAPASLDDVVCFKCGKDENDDVLMLCSNCPRGIHIYCHDPPLKEVPEDDYFCRPECESQYIKKRREEEMKEAREKDKAKALDVEAQDSDTISFQESEDDDSTEEEYEKSESSSSSSSSERTEREETSEVEQEEASRPRPALHASFDVEKPISFPRSGSANPSLAHSVTALDRRALILKIVQEVKVIEFGSNFLNMYDELLEKMGKSQKHKIDRKTMRRALQQMEAAGEIKLLNTSTKRLGGTTKLVVYVLEKSLTPDDEIVRKTMSVTTSANLLGHSGRHFVRQKLDVLETHVERLIPEDIQKAVESKPVVTSRKQQEAANVYYGFIGAKMIRVRLLHEWLVRLFLRKEQGETSEESSTNPPSYRDDGIFNSSEIVEQLSLSMYLKLVSLPDRYNVMDTAAGDENLLLKPLREQVDEVKELVKEQRNRSKQSLESLFQCLLALGIIVELTDVPRLNVESALYYKLLCQVPLYEFADFGTKKLIRYVDIDDDIKCQQFWAQFEFMCLRKTLTYSKLYDSNPESKGSFSSNRRPVGPRLLGEMGTGGVQRLHILAEQEDSNDSVQDLGYSENGAATANIPTDLPVQHDGLDSVPLPGCTYLMLNDRKLLILNKASNWVAISPISADQRAILDSYVDSRLRTTPLENVKLCQEIAKSCGLPILAVRQYYKRLHFQWLSRVAAADQGPVRKVLSVRKRTSSASASAKERSARIHLHKNLTKSGYRTVNDTPSSRGALAKQVGVVSAAARLQEYEQEHIPVVEDEQSLREASSLKHRIHFREWTSEQDELIVFAYSILYVSYAALKERFTPWTAVSLLIFGDDEEMRGRMARNRSVLRRRFMVLSKRSAYFQLMKLIRDEYSKIQAPAIQAKELPVIDDIGSIGWLKEHIDYMRGHMKDKMLIPGALTDVSADEGNDVIELPENIADLFDYCDIDTVPQDEVDFNLAITDENTTTAVMSTLLGCTFMVRFMDCSRVFDFDEPTTTRDGKGLLLDIIESLIKKILLTPTNSYNAQFAYHLLSLFPSDLVAAKTQSLHQGGSIVGTKSTEYRRISGRGFQLSDRFLAVLQGNLPANLLPQARHYRSSLYKKLHALVDGKEKNLDSIVNSSPLCEFSSVCSSGAMVVLLDLLSHLHISVVPHFAISEKILMDAFQVTPTSILSFDVSSKNFAGIISSGSSKIGRVKRSINIGPGGSPDADNNGEYVSMQNLQEMSTSTLLSRIKEDVLCLLPYQMDIFISPSYTNLLLSERSASQKVKRIADVSSEKRESRSSRKHRHSSDGEDNAEEGESSKKRTRSRSKSPEKRKKGNSKELKRKHSPERTNVSYAPQGLSQEAMIVLRERIMEVLLLPLVPERMLGIDLSILIDLASRVFAWIPDSYTSSSKKKVLKKIDALINSIVGEDLENAPHSSYLEYDLLVNLKSVARNHQLLTKLHNSGRDSVLTLNSGLLYTTLMEGGHNPNSPLLLVGKDAPVVIHRAFEKCWEVSVETLKVAKNNKFEEYSNVEYKDDAPIASNPVGLNKESNLEDATTSQIGLEVMIDPMTMMAQQRKEQTSSTALKDEIPIGATSEKLTVLDRNIPQLAWYDLNNDFQDVIFSAFCDSVMLLIVTQPGISFKNVHASMKLTLSKVELTCILDYLCKDGRLIARKLGVISKGNSSSIKRNKSGQRHLLDENGRDYSNGIGALLLDDNVGQFDFVEDTSAGWIFTGTNITVEPDSSGQNFVDSIYNMVTCYWPTDRWYSLPKSSK